MGQSSSQRKAQHQDVELWELYEEDRRHSEHSRRKQSTDRADREKRARNTGTGGRDGRNRTAVRGGRAVDYDSSERQRRNQEDDRERQWQSQQDGGSSEGRRRNQQDGRSSESRRRSQQNGRSNESRRRNQEDDRDSERSRRSVDERRRERNNVDGNRRFRDSGREAERTGQAGLDSLDIVNVTRSAAGGNNTGHSGSRRRPEGAGGSNSRMLRVYGQGAGASRTGRSGGSVDVRQGSGGRQRQRENAVRTGRTGRAGNASQIRYIQPYSGSAQRVGGSAYAYKGNARPVQSIRRRRARRRKELLGKAGVVLLMALCLVMIYFITGQIYQMVRRGSRDKTAEKSVPAVAEQFFQEDSKVGPPDMIEDLLEVNEYSRPGTPLTKINSIFVHYTANPGTSAAQNRSYFANLAQTHERSASAHLIIGYDGELIQCIPFDEQAYAVMTRNEDSISIECCYLSDDGSFTQETYDTLIHTLAWLLKEYDLSTEDILRHYDCGGKLCPLYYAENEGAWEELRQDVADYMAAAE